MFDCENVNTLRRFLWEYYIFVFRKASVKKFRNYEYQDIFPEKTIYKTINTTD